MCRSNGAIDDESFALNLPALTLSESYERTEGMEDALVMMIGLEVDRFMPALQVLESQLRGIDVTCV